MSEWTYVKGSLELESSPVELNKKFNLAEPKREDFGSREEYEEAHDEYRAAYRKALYLPYPEEQFKLGAPIIRGRAKESRIAFDGTCIYSLPRAKKYIEEAFKLFPQGELGFRYWLDQNGNDGTCSSSGFLLPCLYKYYRGAIDRMYSQFSSRWDDSKWNFKDLKKRCGVEEDCGYVTVSTIYCGVNTSLRWATAEEVKDSLIKFIEYLKEHGISINDGYLEWYDSYTVYGGFRYAFRTGEWIGEYSIMKLDKDTNKIIWQLNHVHPKSQDSNRTDFDKFVDIEEDFTNKEE